TMYRTLTVSSGDMASPPGGRFLQLKEQEPDPRLELGRKVLERGQGGPVVRPRERGIRDAPVNDLGVRRELRAHLLDPIAQRDHEGAALRDEGADILGVGQG